MKDEKPHRSYLESMIACKCPRCREGSLFKYGMTFLFKRNTEMHETCPVCGQPSDIEVGFYYGTGYVSYLIGIFLTILFGILWYLTIGFSLHDNRFLYWVLINSVVLILLQPWLMRVSRILWLSFFVKYDEDWQVHEPDAPERVNKDQMHNW